MVLPVAESMSMKCSGCGERVTFWGESCPYCGQDKSDVQSVRVLAWSGILALCALGYSFWGIGGFVICVIGLCGCAASYRIVRPRRE
jgi:hypothetical protein